MIIVNVDTERTSVLVDLLAFRTFVSDSVVLQMNLQDMSFSSLSANVGTAYSAHEAVSDGDQVLRGDGFHVCNKTRRMKFVQRHQS